MWRRRDPRWNPFDEFGREFEDINDMLERMIRTVQSRTDLEPGKPLVYGFSMKVGPDGIPHIEQFGNEYQALWYRYDQRGCEGTILVQHH